MLVAAVVVLLCLGACVYVARDYVATRLATLAIERKPDMRCTALRVHLPAALDMVVVSPVTCHFEALPIREFSSSDSAVVTLRGAKPESVHVARASLTQRDRDLSRVDMNAPAELATITGATDELVKNMLDACVMYQADMPDVTIDELTPRRADKPQPHLYGFRKGMDGTQNRTRASRIGPVDGIVTLADLDMANTAEQAQARVDIYWGKREPGDKPAMRLSLRAAHANTDHPQVTLSVH